MSRPLASAGSCDVLRCLRPRASSARDLRPVRACALGTRSAGPSCAGGFHQLPTASRRPDMIICRVCGPKPSFLCLPSGVTVPRPPHGVVLPCLPLRVLFPSLPLRVMLPSPPLGVELPGPPLRPPVRVKLPSLPLWVLPPKPRLASPLRAAPRRLGRIALRSPPLEQKSLEYPQRVAHLDDEGRLAEQPRRSVR